MSPPGNLISNPPRKKASINDISIMFVLPQADTLVTNDRVPTLKRQQQGTNKKLHKNNICFNFWYESGSSCIFGSDSEAAERIGGLYFLFQISDKCSNAWIHFCLSLLALPTFELNLIIFSTDTLFVFSVRDSMTFWRTQMTVRLLAIQAMLWSIKMIKKKKERETETERERQREIHGLLF